MKATGTRARTARVGALRWMRSASTWNGRGRPSGPTATISPSSAPLALPSFAAATISGNWSVTRESPRAKIATSEPRLCTCARMPSILSSITRRSGESGVLTFSRGVASMKAAGRPISNVACASLSPRARPATTPASPVRAKAHRTDSTSRSKARAIAARTRVSCAPTRRPPPSERKRYFVSSGVQLASARKRIGPLSLRRVVEASRSHSAATCASERPGRSSAPGERSTRSPIASARSPVARAHAARIPGGYPVIPEATSITRDHPTPTLRGSPGASPRPAQRRAVIWSAASSSATDRRKSPRSASFIRGERVARMASNVSASSRSPGGGLNARPRAAARPR